MQARARYLVIVAISACTRGATAPPDMGGTRSAVARAGERQEAKLVAVEVFDTDPAGAELVLARHGYALRALLRDKASDVATHVKGLVDEIRADGNYAYVESALVTYDQPYARYLTIDIVDQRDARQRMPFSIAPTGSYPDPQGLLASWQRYEDKFLELLVRGDISGRPAACPALQCLGDPQHPALRPLVAKMTAGVPSHLAEIEAILRDDHRPKYRATAAYLLAYAPDGQRVVTELLQALHDPSALVRNNAMRVLAEIALHHSELAVPVGPVIEALRYPAATDRNKAAAILDRLLDRPGSTGTYRSIIHEAGATLLAMLHLQQPNNHDFAYEILKKISGKAYGEQDYVAWQAWLTRAAAE